MNLKSSEVFVSNDLEGSLCSISQEYRNQSIKPVLVDFTHPDSVFDNTRSAIAYGISPIIGTTGLSPSQINDLSIFAQKAEVGCAIIPNFSVGMVLLQQAASVAAKKGLRCHRSCCPPRRCPPHVPSRSSVEGRSI